MRGDELRRRTGSRAARVALAGLLAGCVPPPPPPPLAPPPPAPPALLHPLAWSARPGVELAVEADSSTVRLALPFTRLEVFAADSESLRVRCGGCPGAPLGRVSIEDVVVVPRTPEEAASEGLAEFALAVREAALRHDLAALLPVMASGFTFSFLGTQGATTAVVAWEAEHHETLDKVPELLDQGLATRDSTLWVAPPAHFEQLDFRGLRLGFRRGADGRWEWVFLIRSVVPG